MSFFFKVVKRLACGGLLAAVFTFGDALAQGSGAVPLGGLTKNSSGVVLAMDMGDYACILSLRDDKGTKFQEMAESSICQKRTSIMGKRVALTYIEVKVPADECQGNPDCSKSRRISLVNSVRVVDSGQVPVPGQPIAPPAETVLTSFCTSGEKVIFACRIGAKLVSVCASTDASRSQGYVQYRFGSPKNSNLEMMVPERTDRSVKLTTAASESFSSGGGSWMRFRNGAVSYVVYDGVGKWGQRGEIVETRGVVVERNGKTAINLRCTGKPINNMGPELFGSFGLTTQKDEDFDFSQ